MTDRVVNLRDFRCPQSRGGFNLPRDVVRIDRPSRWGNPYKIGAVTEAGTKITRDVALTLYRAWLTGRCEGDPTFLYPLRRKRLACWCAPLPCHGDILVEFIEAADG